MKTFAWYIPRVGADVEKSDLLKATASAERGWEFSWNELSKVPFPGLIGSLSYSDKAWEYSQVPFSLEVKPCSSVDYVIKKSISTSS